MISDSKKSQRVQESPLGGLNFQHTETEDKKYGIVVLLDALGARTASIEESKNYMTALEAIKEDIQSSNELEHLDIPNEIRKSFGDITPRIFGDSILITSPLRDREIATLGHGLKYIGSALAFLMTEAIHRKILFRGAVSIGDYISNPDLVLGPAVADVANWYEQLNMVGVMATPKASFHFKRLSVATKLDVNMKTRVFDRWEAYAAPTKLGEMETYMLDWPYIYSLNCTSVQEAELRFYEGFNEFEQPLGTEQKYANTEKFFSCLVNRYQESFALRKK
jgi:hypothetical protein